MPSLFSPKVATSNHLLDGDVIYFTNPGWTRDIAKASVAHTREDADALLSAASSYQLETVGVVLTDVTLASGMPAPVHFRESFRTRGPSNYFHGKQADHV